MHKLHVAALALCPLALQAQAIRPAQPVAPGFMLQSQMVARLAMEAVAGAFPAVTAPAPAPAPAVRITTGVSNPELIKTVSANLDGVQAWLAIPRTVTVSMTVNEQGIPTDLKVVQSVNSAIDQRILTAVQQYRFKPSMLDGEPIARQLTLEVKIPTNTGR